MSGQTDGRFALRVTIVFSAVIAAAYGFGVYLFAALLPDMRQGLGLGYTAIGAMGAARQVAFLATALASPAVIRRVGAGGVILGSMLVCGAALCGLALTHAPWVAIGLLVTLNACAASAWIPMVSLVTKVVAFRQQGKAVGLIASGTNYGLCANGILVPVLLPSFGWRSVWFAAGGLTLTLCGCLWWTMRSPALRSFGHHGAIRKRPPWRFAIESRYVTVYALAGIGGLAGVPFVNYVFAYIRGDLGLSVAVAGEVGLAMGLSGAIGGVLLGTLGDKFGLRAALATATAILATSGLIEAIGTTGAPLMIGASGFGVSFFAIFGLLPAYVGKTADERITPTICGLIECALGLGGSAGSALGGLTPQITGSFRPVFVCTAVLGLVMLALTPALTSELTQLPGRRPTPRPPPHQTR